jgi:hypothetical protein
MGTTTLSSDTGEGYCSWNLLEKLDQFSFTINRFELDEEMYIACAIVNESLYDTNADKKKVVKMNYSVFLQSFFSFLL